jgi:hypothetical protein
MPAPALSIPIRADVDKFKSDMNATSEVAHSAVRRITSSVIEMNAGFLATQGALGGATLAVGRFLPVVNQVLLAFTAIKGTINLMEYATDLAKKKIEEFNTVAQDANASGFSTEFFQRITKSGGQARDKVDELTSALKRFNDASTSKLGGGDLQQRLDELTKAGNGTPGTSIVGNNSEEKLRSTVAIIDDMLQKGQRVAALDLAGTAFGPKVQAALRADSGYLDDMLKRADTLSKSQIVSQEDVGRALELKERMEAAQKVLSDKWKPVQDDLAKLGMNYHESWVNITEDLAAAVGYATQLYQALGKVPDWFANRIGGASIWTSLTNATTTPESRAASEAGLGISSDPKDIGMVAANNALRAALQNHNNVTRGMQQATDVATAVRGDTSKNPGDKTTGNDTPDAFDRATESIVKHTARLEADTAAVGKGAAAQAELRAESQLFAAAQQAGLPITDKMRDKIQDLAQDAGDAAAALEKAKVASDISFGSKTALLSSDDASIARQLSGIYGNDVPAALASSEAAAIRFNGALRSVSTSIEGDLTTGLTDITTGTKSVSQGFSDMSAAIIRDIEQMIIKLTVVAPLMRALQSGFSSLGLGSIGGGAASTTGADGLAAIHHGGYGPGDSFPTRSVSLGHFANAPRFHTGVGPGERAAIIRTDESVLTPGQMRALAPVARGGSAGDVNVVVNNAPSTPGVSQRQNADGSRDIMIDFRDAVRGVMADDVSKNGPISQAISAKQTGFNGR